MRARQDPRSSSDSWRGYAALMGSLKLREAFLPLLNGLKCAWVHEMERRLRNNFKHLDFWNISTFGKMWNGARSLFQKSCIDFAIQARPLERYMPKEMDSFKYKIWRVVVSTPFEYFIMILIVLNTILLMMKVSARSVSRLHFFLFKETNPRLRTCGIWSTQWPWN